MAPARDDYGISSATRRSFLSLSAAATAAMALRIVTEPMLAHARPQTFSPDAIRIDSNENPLGPSASAREAAAAIVSQGGRYSGWLTDDLVKALAEKERVKAEEVQVYAGSSGPLHYSVAAFASPERSYVTADPGYEAGMFAAKAVGAKAVKIPLTKSYAHDVDAHQSFGYRISGRKQAQGFDRAGR
jgi:histidinol-phosphate aminotransferase